MRLPVAFLSHKHSFFMAHDVSLTCQYRDTCNLPGTDVQSVHISYDKGGGGGWGICPHILSIVFM